MLNNLTKAFRKLLPINILSIVGKPYSKPNYPNLYNSKHYNNKGTAVKQFYKPVSKYIDYGRE